MKSDGNEHTILAVHSIYIIICMIIPSVYAWILFVSIYIWNGYYYAGTTFIF